MIDFLKLLKEDNIDNIDFTPLHKEYMSPAVNKNEALRYAGYPAAALSSHSASASGNASPEAEYLKLLADRCRRCGKNCDMSAACDGDLQEPEKARDDARLYRLLDDTLEMIKGEVTYRVTYCCVPVKWDRQGCPILPFEQDSKDLKTNLTGCRGAIIFAATIGAGIDRLIRRYERVKPASALLLQGLGAERVESLCDAFNEEVIKACEALGLKAHPRYSPGYGDLPISVQPQVLKLVDAEKRIGITLNESMLMSPSKSVTAIIGIE